MGTTSSRSTLRSRLRSLATAFSRTPLIGVPLATLRDRAGIACVASPSVGGVHDGAVDPQDFYAYQVRMPMRDALRAPMTAIR